MINTTNYVLELLISGISTLLWVVLLAVTFWGNDIEINFEGIQTLDKLLIILIIAPIFYVVGIVNDRLIDNLFSKSFNPRLNKFADLDTYRKARSAIYLNSETLTSLFEYGRMRIRICRNWTVNAIFIFLSGLLFIWSKSASNYILNYETKLEISIVFSIMMIFSIYASFVSWKDLNNKEFEFLEIQSNILSPKKPEKK